MKSLIGIAVIALIVTLALYSYSSPVIAQISPQPTPTWTPTPISPTPTDTPTPVPPTPTDTPTPIPPTPTNTPVPNEAPIVNIDQSSVTVDEGQTATNSGSVSDPDNDLVTLSASVGTVVNNNDGSWSWSFPTTDGPENNQTVEIHAVDDRNTETTALFELTVNNVPPWVATIAAQTNPISLDEPVIVTVVFTDPGVIDSQVALLDWGDDSRCDTATNSDCTLDQQAPGEWVVKGSHSYAQPGVYTVMVTVTDDDGGSDTQSFEYVVVYDPEGGFVTGGGWIDSPEGTCRFDACTADTTGKATFGFVSKYKKGADVPTGNTEFQFKAGNLNFRSTSYQWLVVAGHKAQFKGEGTINGEGNYGFMLTAIDEELTPSTDVDMFRIKIWDKDSEDTVYDNQMGESEDSDAATSIGGGSIVIHQAK